MVYLIVGATAVLLIIVTGIVASQPSSWTSAALIGWLLLTLVLSTAWVVGRPHGLGLRRIDALWQEDRFSALLLVKVLIAAAAIVVLIALVFVLE